MKDGVIKGTGDSRYLKSVVDFLTRYPNYETFAQALMEGRLPIDLNGINPDGWTQQGTPLDKASLLSDATAARIGLENDDPTPDQALSALLPKSGGSMNGTLEDPAAAQVRNITISDQNLEAGVSELPTGEVYLVYE